LNAFLQQISQIGATRLVLMFGIAAGVALALNALLNWVLIYGKFGFDPLGAEGSAWATTIVRSFLTVGIIAYI